MDAMHRRSVYQVTTEIHRGVEVKGLETANGQQYLNPVQVCLLLFAGPIELLFKSRHENHMDAITTSRWTVLAHDRTYMMRLEAHWICRDIGSQHMLSLSSSLPS